MSLNSQIPRRAPFIAAAMVLLLTTTACGRRGPLEAPVDPAAPPPAAATPAPLAAPVPGSRALPADRRLRPDGVRRSTQSSAAPTTLATQQSGILEDAPADEEEEETSSFKVSPSPVPRKQRRDFIVPTDSFVLDPLL